MFVAYTYFSAMNAEELDDFANPKTFPKAFTDCADDGGVLIEDDYRYPADGTLDANVMCYLFYAKDKQTLKDGLKACPAGAKISGGNKQLGFFTGSYDIEKSGAWFRMRQEAAQMWGTLSQDQRQGAPRKRVNAAFNRKRLMERGYFALVCRTFLLTSVRQATKVIGTEISLTALGSMLSGRMTREQAVGGLMQDLLIT
jgi:hypothetical protein